MLLCVFGNSGAGKDTIINKIFDDYYVFKQNNALYVEGEWQYPSVAKLVLCTTRPPRPEEVNDFVSGNYYHFMSDIRFADAITNNQLVESRSYLVANGGVWKYGTYEEDLRNALESDTVFITTCTPNQFTAYYNFATHNTDVAGDDYRSRLYPVFIGVKSEKERMLRLLNRSNGSFDDIKEVCRRFSQDSEYIDQSKVPERFLVYNDNVEDTASYVLNLIDTFDCTGATQFDVDWNIDCTCPDTFGNLIVREMLY